MSPEVWQDLLLAFLHDPPDKALDIRGHVERARNYIRVALGDRIEGKLGGVADQQAARAERLPAPHWEYVKVDPEGKLTIFHPLSGKKEDLPVDSCDPNWVTDQIRKLITEVGEDTEGRFFALWRLLPERLAAGRREYARLPADTRIPDHTIWHHLDITAGLQAANVESATGVAFLSFSVGPVQTFISTARTVRDLWSGSMILSFLAFKAMLPVIKQCGPTALVYPSLRGLPLLDLWLRRKFGWTDNLLPKPETARKQAPCLPNRFLAVVPFGVGGETAEKLSGECRQAAAQAWFEMASTVNGKLSPSLGRLYPEWGNLWQQQIESFFEFRTALLPWNDFKGSPKEVDKLWQLWGKEKKTFREAFDGPDDVRKIHDAIPEKEKPGFRGADGTWHPYKRPMVGDWQAKVELSGRLMEAAKAIRHFPAYDPGSDDVPPKCSMFGTYEQMGPADLGESAEFWKNAANVNIDGVRLRERERLCAVALVKRFSGPCFFRDKLELERHDLRYDDTATVAAAEWLWQAELDPKNVRDKHGDWSGQWLHWPRRDFDEADPCPLVVWELIEDAKRRMKPEPPPIYYAVLMMDGDKLSDWLRGENSPRVREVLHPKLVEYFRRLPGTKVGLDARRPVGPALHAALSSALANFALHVVPHSVEEHHGTLIYSGGDDTLALLPTSQALACARALQQAYRREYDDQGRLFMGERATLSAGLAVVHYKEDLRAALDAARDAEKQAKKTGRDALVITACRRSGERASALCPWEFVDKVAAWVQAFRDKASDRWAYHLRAELTTLQGLPVEAMRAEIRRQIRRAEEGTKKAFPPDQLAEDFDRFRQFKKKVKDEEGSRFCNDADALTHFLTLVQTASFLARGRDS